jgi:hypothetical protein
MFRTVPRLTQKGFFRADYATEHAEQTGGKPWAYALVPHDAVLPSATLAGLMTRYGLTVAQGLSAVR